VSHWIEYTLLKRRVKLTSGLVSIQARVHEADATGYVLSRELNPKLVHLVLPNRYEPKRAFVSTVIDRSTGEPWQDRRTAEDELLNPAILDQATTDQERAAPDGAALDASQNQQDPAPEGGIIFRPEMFKRWSHDPEPEIPEDWTADEPTYPTHPLPESWDFIFITCDPNNLKKDKATKGTDYAVFDVWGVCDGSLYLICQLRQKLNVSASIRALVDLIPAYEADIARILIESKANGTTVINGLRAVLGIADEGDLPKTHQFVRAWDVQGETKIQRAKVSVGVAEAGRVYIQDEQENGEMIYWLAEVCGFPNRTRDDRVDTLTMAMTYLERHPRGD